MTIKVRITFSQSNDTLDCRSGIRYAVHGFEVPYEHLTIGDLTDRIAETEEHLSRITGLAVKIETGEEA